MASEHYSSDALAKRERTGSEKRAVGIQQISRMLPGSTYTTSGGKVPDDLLAPELLLMGMEDSYCDMWSRTDVIDARTRSIATVSMMVAAGNVGNHFELRFHAPAAIYNGVTLEELEAILVHARAYVGSPTSAWARESMENALKAHGLLVTPRPAPDFERRERTGSQKRAIARKMLNEIDPTSPLINAGDELPSDMFAPELEFMILENCYSDLWARTDVLDLRTRSVVTIGMLIGLHDYPALRSHVPVARRNGLTVPELEEIVYQAATYLGYPTGSAARDAIATGIDDSKAG